MAIDGYVSRDGRFVKTSKPTGNMFEHRQYISPYQQFQQGYPNIDKYGRNVLSGRRFAQTISDTNALASRAKAGDMQAGEELIGMFGIGGIAKKAVPLIINDGIGDVVKMQEKLPKIKEGFKRLYKAESPTVNFEDVFDINKLTKFKKPKDMKGDFYTDELSYADYFRETYGRDAVINYIDIPNDIAKSRNIGIGEYIIDTIE